jgi:hypothetical protein
MGVAAIDWELAGERVVARALRAHVWRAAARDVHLALAWVVRIDRNRVAGADPVESRQVHAAKQVVRRVVLQQQHHKMLNLAVRRQDARWNDGQHEEVRCPHAAWTGPKPRAPVVARLRMLLTSRFSSHRRRASTAATRNVMQLAQVCARRSRLGPMRLRSAC